MLPVTATATSSTSSSHKSDLRASVRSTVVKPILAGALTGGIEALVMYPTEYIKTHLQLQDKANPRYRGIVDCFTKTVNESGFLGLYRGVMPLLIGSIPKQASRWGTYELACSSTLSLKRVIFDIPPNKKLSRKDLSMVEVSLCGCVAGAVEALVAVVPTETIKTVMIDDAKLPNPRFARRSLFFTCRTLIREEGLKGMYKGVSNTVTKQGLNQAVRFPAQLAAMNIICAGDERRRKSALWNGVGGFFAGVFSVFLTQPFDVVKTKMQGVSAQQYKSSWDCWQTVARESGLRHFYAGSVARMLRVGGNVALTFTLFPLIKDLL